jgi:hypothetical protein
LETPYHSIQIFYIYKKKAAAKKISGAARASQLAAARDAADARRGAAKGLPFGKHICNSILRGAANKSSDPATLLVRH